MNAPTTAPHVRTAIREALGNVRPVDMRTAAEYYDRRAAFCLTTAQNTLALAETVGERGDVAAMGELVREAQDFMAEYRRINAMRVNPV
ncbi:hypothetical protein [Nocardia cyriacigeorgica]|uniref:hypothetical protein n=1 Tax=Nocardia cyriacigeorgica TaxID=135487 RepID=UPI00245523F6|nr:hypothetical protein [Nocardia cyriacigeorgica]